jgi:hypothetical protein
MMVVPSSSVAEIMSQQSSLLPLLQDKVGCYYKVSSMQPGPVVQVQPIA